VKGQRVAEASEEMALVDRCRAGDRAAFGRLITLYQDRVFNLCLRICGNAADAEDYAQEAFIKAMRSIDRFDGRSRFYTWLFRIAVNATITGRRSRKTTMLSLDQRPAHTDDSDSAQMRDDLMTRETAPPERAVLHEEHAAVMAALGELDDEYRAAIILRDVESLDYAEIADVLGVAVGTVKSRLHRARLALRERLRPIRKPSKNG
jgi:RNA polymerase sigma-70 factor (ECF subfamily)